MNNTTVQKIPAAGASRAWAGLGTRGASTVEYIMLVGVVALAAIVGFKQARQREDRAVYAQALAVASLETPESEWVQVGDYLCSATYCIPGSGKCFAGGTPVATEEGLRAIETVREGDRVWARDERTGAVELRPVLRRVVTHGQPVMSLIVAASDGGEVLRVTSGHRFWVTAQGWVAASDLGADQSLWSPSGEPLHVEPGAAPQTSHETVYNFEVADFHSYFVGRHGVLVHNGPGDPCQSVDRTPVSGETSATAIGKRVHKLRADARRVSGDWDEVNETVTDEDGVPIEVSKRVDLKTGRPVGPLQKVRPDAVSYERGEILDDKPAGRDIAKDRQEIIRFIRAYQAKTGELPKTIIIERYDPTTGAYASTERYNPDVFLVP